MPKIWTQTGLAKHQSQSGSSFLSLTLVVTAPCAIGGNDFTLWHDWLISTKGKRKFRKDDSLPGYLNYFCFDLLEVMLNFVFYFGPEEMTVQIPPNIPSNIQIPLNIHAPTDLKLISSLSILKASSYLSSKKRVTLGSSSQMLKDWMCLHG